MSGSPCAFPVPLELGAPPKTETPAASMIWFPLGFGDTSKFGSSSISNGWDLWQGSHSEPLWNLCLMCLPLDFGVPSTPFGFGGPPLCLPHHSRTPPIHQEAQNSAGPLLVYFASRLFSWGSEPLKGGGESRQGVVGGEVRTTQTAPLHASPQAARGTKTTYAKHGTRGGHVSHRHRHHSKGGEAEDHWPSMCKGFWEDGWSLHI